MSYVVIVSVYYPLHFFSENQSYSVYLLKWSVCSEYSDVGFYSII